MIRVVIGTGVAVSGLLWPGPPLKLLEHAQAGRCAILATPDMLAQITRVLQRGKFARRLAELQATYEAPVAFYRTLVRICPVPPRAAYPCKDPGDQMFIDLAVAERVHLLISGDQHLLCLRTVGETPVVSVREALGVIDML